MTDTLVKIEGQLSFPESLRQKGLVTSSDKPTFNDLEEIQKLTVSDNLEYGLQVIKTKEGFSKVFVKGTRTGIKAPGIRIPHEAVVFFHSHPPVEEKYRLGYEHHSPLEILPSYDPWVYLQRDGDFMNTKGSILTGFMKGGYMNIVSKDGITLNVGVKGISRDEKLTTEVRKLQKLENEQAVISWKVWTRPNSGLSFSNALVIAKKGLRLVGEENFVLISATDYATETTSYFVYLSWGKMEETGLSLEDLLFGNGVNALMRHLKLESFPYSNNLSEVVPLQPKAEERR